MKNLLHRVMESAKFFMLHLKCDNGEIAQLVEQAAHIRSVRGPSPFLARFPKLCSSGFFFDDLIPSIPITASEY